MNVAIVSYEGPGEGWIGSVRLKALCRAFAQRGDSVLLVTSEVNASWNPIDGVEHLMVKGPWLLRVGSRFRYGGRMDERLFQTGPTKGSQLPTRFACLARRVGSKLERILFIPDSRVLWRHKAAVVLTRTLSQGVYDVLISLGNPVSHMVALDARKKVNRNIVWVAELQDPWPHRVKQRWPAFIQALCEAQEARVMAKSDHLICVTDGIASMYEHPSKSIIPFGTDLKPALRCRMVEPYTIAYYGNLYGGRVNAFQTLLLGILQLLSRVGHRVLPLRVQVFSATARQEVGNILERLGLQSLVDFCDPLPRRRVIDSMASKHVLVSIQGTEHKYAVGSKVYDYIMTDRPIVAVVPPDSCEARFFQRIEGAHVVYTPEEVADALAAILLHPIRSHVRKNAMQYAEDRLAQTFVNVVLDAVLRTHGRAIN